MDGLTLIHQAHEAGLSLTKEGDRLVVRGPRSSEPLALHLLSRKREVLALLADLACSRCGGPTWHPREVCAVCQAHEVVAEVWPGLGAE